MKVSVVVADDHPLFLKGIKLFLAEQGFDIVGEANNGGDAIALIEALKPDLAILDYEMPEKTGLEVARFVKESKLHTKVIFLTFHRDALFIQLAKIEQVGGFVSKAFDPADLLRCIEKVLLGGQYYEIGKEAEPEFEANDASGEDLTRSEIKIVRYVADGMTTKEIADALSIAERTVDKHRSNIIKKLSLEKRPNALLVWAQRNKEFIN